MRGGRGRGASEGQSSGYSWEDNLHTTVVVCAEEEMGEAKADRQAMREGDVGHSHVVLVYAVNFTAP